MLDPSTTISNFEHMIKKSLIIQVYYKLQFCQSSFEFWTHTFLTIIWNTSVFIGNYKKLKKQIGSVT